MFCPHEYIYYSIFKAHNQPFKHIFPLYPFRFHGKEIKRAIFDKNRLGLQILLLFKKNYVKISLHSFRRAFMYFRHNLDYQYPERSDQHMIAVKHLRDTHFDENYPYIPKGFWAKLKRISFWIACNLIAIPAVTIRHGVTVYGRKKLKKYKKEFKNGAITVSNHVFMWDYLCVSKVIRPHLAYFPAWKTNLEGPNGPLIRWAGGIPVPTDNFRAMGKFQRAICEVLETKRWLHFFPEGSMWFYYPDIRPLKKAVFKYAVRYDRPILPITMSFRPRKGFWRLFSKNPMVDVHIGDPIFPDKTLPTADAVQRLHSTTYHVMQVMNGIHPGDPTYNLNQNIAEYEKTM